MGRPLSSKDLERVQEAVAKLEGAAETTDADWAKLRSDFKRLTQTKLAELRQEAQEKRKNNSNTPATIDLREEFARAKAEYEDIKKKMDRVYSIAVEGIPVIDMKTGVAAMNVKRSALTDLAKLMNLMVPAADETKSQSELEQAVGNYLLPLNLTSDDAPFAEIVRMAGAEIMRLNVEVGRKLRVVG
jgi:hypothetical protein